MKKKGDKNRSPLTRGSVQFGGAYETLMSLKIASLPCGATFSALKQRGIFVKTMLSRARHTIINQNTSTLIREDYTSLVSISADGIKKWCVFFSRERIWRKTLTRPKLNPNVTLDHYSSKARGGTQLPHPCPSSYLAANFNTSTHNTFIFLPWLNSEEDKIL